MAGLGDFTNQFISQTYHRVLQLYEGVVVDGTGSATSLIISGNLNVVGNIIGSIQSASYVPLIAGPNINIRYTPSGIEVSASATGGTSSLSFPPIQSQSVLFAINGNVSGSSNIRIDNFDDLSITGSLYVSNSIEAGNNGRRLIRADGGTAIDWQNSIIYDPAGNEVIQFDGLILNDSSTIPILNGSSRHLINSSNQIVVAFSSDLYIHRPVIISSSVIVSNSIQAADFFGNNASIYNIGATSIASVGFTGSLLGTASYALQTVFATSASYAATASYINDTSLVRTTGGTPNSLPAWSDTHQLIDSPLITDGARIGLYTLDITQDIMTIDAISAGDPSLGLTVSGTLKVAGNIVSNGITGSLFGTASLAITALDAVSSSYSSNALSSSYSITASSAVSAAYAATASYVLNLPSASVVKTDTLIFSIDGGDQPIPSGSTLYGVRYVSGSWTVKNWSIMSKTGKNINLDVQGTTISNFTGSYQTIITGSYPALNATFATQSNCTWSINDQILSIKVRSNYDSCKDVYLFIQIEQ